MHAPNDSTPGQRSVPERILIRSWEYRHLRFWARVRIGGGIALTVCGLLTLAFGGSGTKTSISAGCQRDQAPRQWPGRGVVPFPGSGRMDS
jgi:hypothetical protein